MSGADAEVVLVRRDGDVAVITLNRPQARNAMNAALAAATCEAVGACQDAGAIVITGADPAFCAGLDLRNLGIDKLVDLPPFLAAVADSQVPVIAAVNGPAVTGGFELALVADFIVASERAAFADTHLRVGVYPGPVAVELPRRVGLARAREMSLTGNFVDAQTALRIGLVNHVVAHDELLARATELASAIAEQDRDMVRALRRDWRESAGLPLDEASRVHYEHATRGGFTGAAGADIAARRDAVIQRARTQRG
ncbi:MAG TPA: enoyl-CoA hydratase [Mycobacteriales bacterium]|jgi:enoyl-CoA hydratase|nr:enoyl-CoA hydratase [Mycobacteriales bacterium]